MSELVTLDIIGFDDEVVRNHKVPTFSDTQLFAGITLKFQEKQVHSIEKSLKKR